MSLGALQKHRREFARAVSNHQYERTPTGLFFPRMGVFVGGVFTHELNGQDRQVDPNLIPTEGLNYLLDVAVKNGSPLHPWRVALFTGNYTPVAGVTAASFDGDATEYTDYDETTRVEYEEGVIAAGAVSNSAAKADFTIAAGVVNDIIYGAALISATAKEAVTGTLLAISRFTAQRTVNATDVLSVQYTLTITDGS